MTDVFSITQIVGYVAYVLTVITFWQKNDKRLLLINAASAATWVLHYGLLGAWAGAATEALVTIRSILSVYMIDIRHKHLAAGLFILGFIVIGVITYAHWYDLFVIIACILGTISMVYWKNIQMRWGILASLLCWLLYTLGVGSVGGVLSSITIIMTQIATLHRMYRDKMRSFHD